MTDWIQRLEDGTPVIKKYYVLFIIVFFLGGTISYFVVDKLYEHSLTTRDNTIESRDNTIINKDNKISNLQDSQEKLEKEIITLKDVNKSLNTQLEQQQEDQLVIVKSKEDEIKRLQKQIITLKDEKELKVKKPVLTPEQIESKVRNWLIESDYSVRKMQNEKTHFRFDVISKGGKKTTITLSKLQETLLTLQVVLVPKSNDIEAINKLKKINETSVNIKRSLTNIGLYFDIDPQLKWIIFKEILFVESLTQPNFFEALRHLNSGQVMVFTFLHEALNP